MASSLRRRRSGRKNKRQRAPSAPTPPSRTRSHSEPEASRVDTTSDEESYAAHHKKQSRKFKKKIENFAKNGPVISSYVKNTDSLKQIRFKIRYLTVCLPKKPTVTAFSVILASFMSFLLKNQSFIDTQF